MSILSIIDHLTYDSIIVPTPQDCYIDKVQLLSRQLGSLHVYNIEHKVLIFIQYLTLKIGTELIIEFLDATKYLAKVRGILLEYNLNMSAP